VSDKTFLELSVLVKID